MPGQFYRDVLPGRGHYALFRGKNKQHVWAADLDELTRQTEARIDEPDLYFATASFQNPTSRTQANALYRRALCFDIDAGADKFKRRPDQSYPTQKDAYAAMLEWIKVSGIAPHWVISSGHGLHVYFVLDRDVPVAEWQPVAVALGAHALAHGFKVDSSVTADSARVLRPPGTLHHSGARVRALVRTGKPALALADVWEKTKGHAPAPKREKSRNSLFLDAPQGPPKVLAKVTEHCAAMACAVNARGDVSEPFWRAMLGVIKFTEDGEAAAHAASEGHPEYDYHATQAKLDRWTAGPTTCDTFAGEVPELCGMCKFRGKVKSPIMLGELSVRDRKLTSTATAARAALTATSQAASAPGPIVRLVRGDAVKMEPVRWLWHGFLPLAMLTILGGAPGCGKTTIALSLAATVTRGGQWPDGSRCAAPGDVLVWSGEDGHAVIAARLQAAGADMLRVHFVDGIANSEGEAFDPGRDMLLLEAAAERLEAPRLVILDPIVSAVAGDSHKGAEVRRSLQPVVDLAQRLGCAVLGITHFSKGTSGRDPVERVTGSIAFAALARLVLVAAKVKAEPGNGGEAKRVLMRAKSNIGPDDGGFAYALERVEVAPEVEGQRVAWLEALDGTARELLAEAEAEPASADDEGGARDCAGWLREFLAAGSVPAREVRRCADEAGYAWRTVQRSMQKAGADSRRTGFGKSAEWFLVASDATVAPVTPHTECGANGATGPDVGATGGIYLGGAQ